MTIPADREQAGLAHLVGAAILALTVLLVALAWPQQATAAPIPVGANAIVQADGECLRMRSQPGLAGDVLTCIPDGSTVSVLSDPVASDGLDWQQVRYAGQLGWVANVYLQPAPSAPAPTPVPTAAPTAAPTATPVPVPVPTSANALTTPAPGGLTLGLSGTSDPAALAAAQPFAVESVSVLNVSAQRFLSYIPGAPPFASTLSSASLQPASVVTIKRTGTLTTGAAPARAEPRPVQGAGTALTAPPSGGLTQGVSTTNDPGALAAAQPFPVETISMLDIPSQRWLVYIPGAPAAVSSLNSGSLAVGAVVTVKRAGTSTPPTSTPGPGTGSGGGFTPAPPAPSTPGSVPGPAGNETIDSAAQRTVRLTYYYCSRGSIAAAIGDGGGFCGHMANGELVHDGAAACARSLLGERFRVLGDPLDRVYECTDVGGGVDSGHRDIWFADSDSAYTWWRAVGPNAVIERLES